MRRYRYRMPEESLNSHSSARSPMYLILIKTNRLPFLKGMIISLLYSVKRIKERILFASVAFVDRKYVFARSIMLFTRRWWKVSKLQQAHCNALHVKFGEDVQQSSFFFPSSFL